MGKYKFTKNVEKMIDPLEVGTISFMQTYSEFLPKQIQNKIIKKGAMKKSIHGFCGWTI